MSRLGILAAIAAAAFVLGSDDDDEPAAEGPYAPPAGTRLLLVGDSYSVGFGPYLEAYAAALGMPFRRKGVVGSNVSQWRKWIGSELSALSPATAVLISLGGNSFGRNDPKTVRAHIAELLELVRLSGSAPLWISPPTTPFADQIGVRDMWLSGLGPGTRYFDSTQLELSRQPGDPLGHPDQAGYKAWAEAIWLWASAVLQGS